MPFMALSSPVVMLSQAPDRIVYTYGYVSGQPVGPGQSRVTITLTSEGGGTRLRLTHAFAEAAARAAAQISIASYNRPTIPLTVVR